MNWLNHKCRMYNKHSMQSIRTLLTYLWNKFRNLILYGIIGCCSSSVDFAVFSLLESFGVYYIIANCISVFVGISTSFVLNRRYNFKVKDKTTKRFSIFLLVGLLGLFISNIILFVCIEQLELTKLLSKVLSIVLVVFFQFLLNKHITFKNTK